MSHANKQPRSPYARHKKAPYKYSEAYHRWKAASTRSEQEKQEADMAFRKVFNIPMWRIDPNTGHVQNFKNVMEGFRRIQVA